MPRGGSYTDRRHAPVRLLQVTLDGEGDPATTAAVRRHLGWCPGCRREAEGFRMVTEAVRGLGRPVDAMSLDRLHVALDRLAPPSGA